MKRLAIGARSPSLACTTSRCLRSSAHRGGGGATAYRDTRLWIAFVVHDIGSWDLGDLDGEQGQRHPLRGAHLMGRLFDRDRDCAGICWDGRWWCP